MTKYKLPSDINIVFEEDPTLKQIKEDGEGRSDSELSFYQAVARCLIMQRDHFMVESFRYAKRYGPLDPLEDTAEANYTEGTPIAIKDGEPEEEFQPLKALPSPEEKTKFSKKY